MPRADETGATLRKGTGIPELALNLVLVYERVCADPPRGTNPVCKCEYQDTSRDSKK